MTDIAWRPPETFEERVKRFLAPPKLELARIVAREFKRGEPELALAPYLVDPARAAIDVGANRGIWSHVLARHCPNVFAFECNPKLFRVLAAAAPRNVEALPFALSDGDGAASLFVPGAGRRFSNQGASLSACKVEGEAHAVVAVERRRLDSFDLPPVGFIKIDVEGHELSVVRGALALIARDRPTLIVEIEERHAKRPLAESIGEICALGYRMMFLGEHGLEDAARFNLAAPETMRSARGLQVNNFIFMPV